MTIFSSAMPKLVSILLAYRKSVVTDGEATLTQQPDFSQLMGDDDDRLNCLLSTERTYISGTTQHIGKLAIPQGATKDGSLATLSTNGSIYLLDNKEWEDNQDYKIQTYYWNKKKYEKVGYNFFAYYINKANVYGFEKQNDCVKIDLELNGKNDIMVGNAPELTEEMLKNEYTTSVTEDVAICNAEEPMCIAGVFGGKGSGTYETTKNVVLEAAYFHPTWIRKSARRHGLSTDASFRFERGIDPNGTLYALKQAALLCKELAGAKISSDIVDEYPNKIENPTMRLDFSYVDNLIGKKIGHDVIKNILTSLEIEINSEDAEGLQITVPAYRVDVQRPCDVVEDILRIYGYNNVEIPTQLKSSLTTKAFEDQRHKMQNLVAEQLVGSGFNEILNNSLTKGAYYNELKAYPKENLVTIVNPLSSDLNVMRQTLLFGGLESIMRNANRKMPNLRFFEFGNCYQHFEDKRDDENPMKAYSEETHLGLWITGKRVEGSWAHANEDSSFYELKAHVENILKRIGMPNGMLVCEKSDNDIFSTGLTLKNRSGKVFVEMGIVKQAAVNEQGKQCAYRRSCIFC